MGRKIVFAMHRKPLLSLLKFYLKDFPKEHEKTERFISFVEENGSCFTTEYLPGHVTGSAWIVNNKRKHALLTHHRKLNMWVQLGGHSDGSSDTFNVAFREAKEESGLKNIFPVSCSIFDIDIHLIPKTPTMPEHYHYDVRFLFEADKNEPISVSDESHDVAWFSLEEIHHITSEESVLRMADKTKFLQ